MAEPPSSFSPEAVAGIRVHLDSVRAEGLKILFAVESGSRAWGFPSSDSDYDCRFVYARPVRDHLGLDTRRDVIEFPVEGDVDVSGWDLKKALLLALNGNAVVVEWAKSPISYEETHGFRPRLTGLLDEIVDPAKVSRHYLGLARAQLALVGSLSAHVRLKKLFYLIRPIMALDWMSERGFAALPPMSLLECLDETNVPTDAVHDIRRLIDEKLQTREMGNGPVPGALRHYLEARFGFHEMNPATAVSDDTHRSHRRALAAEFYRTQAEMV